MKIRGKLLILLLAIALVPLIAGGIIQRRVTSHLGRRLSAERREILEGHARATLGHVLERYSSIVQRDKRMIELSVEVQAREVEERLASPPPARRALRYANDFDEGVDLPDDVRLSQMHADEAGPMLVGYDDQAYFVVATADEADISDDMMRLSAMPQLYRSLRQAIPYGMKWQYTSLAVGLHTTYPSHGGYPSDYDPRVRNWYIEARDAGELTWVSITDVTTGVATLTAAQPVYGPDGEFAGVTAIDVPASGVLHGLMPPVQWRDVAVAMFVGIGEEGTEYARQAGIIAEARQIGQHRDWRKPVELSMLTSDDPEELALLIADAQEGRSGVRRMGYLGQDALWAYSSVVEKEGGFALVILPYETIMAPAREGQQHVRASIAEGLQIMGACMFIVAALVAVTAARASRAVTRPILALTEAAEELAGGNYDARTAVRCCDEIGELAAIFNDMGPKLLEREKMKRSLALAMEVQQHLLPMGPPELDGFDIAGKSIYCDETGGDYYDFIDLMDLGPGKLGIAVGDVTGHGIGAALLMASARAVLRSHAGRMGGDLAGLFQTLNHHLVRDSGDARFMTLFYGILDSSDRSLRWTSGGHDPAIWLRQATGEFEELPNLDIPLGIEEGRSFEPGGPVTLEAGDIVVIGTDGIWEAANAAGEMFGKDRLRSVIADHADEPARYIHATVVDAVTAFLDGEPQEDDITLVVIEAV